MVIRGGEACGSDQGRHLEQGMSEGLLCGIALGEGAKAARQTKEHEGHRQGDDQEIASEFLAAEHIPQLSDEQQIVQAEVAAVQQQKARDVLYSQVVKGLTTQITQDEIDRIAGSAGSAKYDDIIFTGSYQRVQEFYEVSEMSDGLPVVPPTPEKIEYYLQFTNMAATDIVNEKNGEIIGVKPAYKTITAYQVAVNAIMAENDLSVNFAEKAGMMLIPGA